MVLRGVSQPRLVYLIAFRSEGDPATLAIARQGVEFDLTHVSTKSAQGLSSGLNSGDDLGRRSMIVAVEVPNAFSGGLVCRPPDRKRSWKGRPTAVGARPKGACVRPFVGCKVGGLTLH